MELKCETSVVAERPETRQHFFYFFMSRFVGVVMATALCRRVKVERVVFNALVPQPRDGSAAKYLRLRRFPLSSVRAGLAFSGEADPPSTDARRVPQPGSATPATATTPGATTIFGRCRASVPDAFSPQIDWRFTETPYKSNRQPLNAAASDEDAVWGEALAMA